MANETPPRWDRGMQQRLVRGEAAALGELYDGFASLVHGLAHRFLEDEAAADRIVGEVFAEAWENPGSYEPQKGSIRSWLAGITHRRAVRCLRERARDAGGGADDRIEERVRAASAAARADYIVTAMPDALRDALELAYSGHRDYRETAAELGVNEDEARRRLRLGLQLLSTAVPDPAADGGSTCGGTSRGTPGDRPGEQEREQDREREACGRTPGETVGETPGGAP